MTTFPHAPPVVRIVDLHKSYGSATCLNGISLRIEAGECVGLIGLNGAGKTSLLRTLLGLTDHDRGEIELFDKPPWDASARRGVAYLPERFVPPATTTGEAYVRLMFKLYGTPYSASRFLTELEALRLGPDLLRKQLGALSKGEAQKLGLATTLGSARPFLVYDEPMSGLDPQARALLRARLKLVRGRHAGQTILFSSHLLEDVTDLCDRIAIIHQGGLRFDGTPARCLSRFQADNLERAFLTCIAA